MKRGDSDDERDGGRRRSRCESGAANNRGSGFCDDCNVSIPADKFREHYNSQLHYQKTRGKVRCYLCGKAMANARQHLELNHQVS